MNSIYMIFSLFTTAIVTLTMERVMRVFFEKRRTPLPVLIFSYLFFWFALSLQFWVESILTIILLYFIALILISFNYKATMMQRMSAVAGSYFVLHATTSVFLFFAYAFPSGLLGDYMNFPFVLAVTLSYIITVVIFSRIKKIKNTTAELHKIGFPFLLLAFTHLFFAILNQFNLPFTVAIYDLMGSLITVFAIFFLYNRLSKAVENNVKSALHAQEKDYYYAQCQLMQESVENIKSIRHDMKFHLATARDFIANNKTDEASDYLNGLIGDIVENVMYSNTKNISFDSIINFKLNNAKQENIKLDIRLLIPPSLNIEVTDIVTIMGNLLDNALDAVSKVEDKMIKLDIEYSRESLFIQMDNTFDGVVQYAKETNEDGKRVVTRKGSGEHGHGLKNIRKSVEKYNGHFDISHEGNIFSAVVLLYVSDI